MPKQYKDQVSVSAIKDTNFVKLNMTLTRGKALAMMNALIAHSEGGSPVGTDLYHMLNNAWHTAGINLEQPGR